MSLSPLNTRREWVAGLLQVGALLGLLGWLSWQGATSQGYRWNWYRLPRYLVIEDEGVWHAGPLLQGLGLTLEIVAWSLVLALLFGLAAALLRLSSSAIGRAISRTYLEVIRNTPLLIQLFFIYFVLAPILGMERFTAAVLALALFEGAYASEIIRAGILSIDKGQWEASLACGMNLRQTYQHIVLPQAIRRMTPPLMGQAISLVKDSALVSTVAIYDLSMQARAIVSETFLTFEIWLTVAAIYLFLNLTLAGLVRLLEVRLDSA